MRQPQTGSYLLPASVNLCGAMMSRTAPFLVSAIVIAVAGLTLSCGSSTSGGGQHQGSYNVVGNWQVGFSVTVGASNGGMGAIDSTGVAAFFDTGGNIFQLPTITGTSTFSGSLNAYAENANPFPGGVYSLTDSAQGTVTSATTIGGTFTALGTPGTFNLVPFSPLSGANVPLSGAYRAKFLGFTDVVNFNFASDGTFTGSDDPSIQIPGCGFNGTLTQQGSSNVFDMTFSTMASNSCIATNETGIAFQSKIDYFNVNNGADTNYFYVMMLTSTLQTVRPYVIVIYQ